MKWLTRAFCWRQLCRLGWLPRPFQNHGQPCNTASPLDLPAAGKADLTAQLRRPVPPPGPAARRGGAGSPGAAGGGGWGGVEGPGKRCRKVEKASGKGVSKTGALGAGALEQTREVGGGRGAACSHVRPTWDTSVTMSALHLRASGQHVPGFRLRDRNPSVNPSSRAARGLRSTAGPGVLVQCLVWPQRLTNEEQEGVSPRSSN